MVRAFAWGKADRGLRSQPSRPCISETTAEIALRLNERKEMLTGAYALYYEKAGVAVGDLLAWSHQTRLDMTGFQISVTLNIIRGSW
jgi:hypothetical protein